MKKSAKNGIETEIQVQIGVYDVFVVDDYGLMAGRLMVTIPK